MKQLLLFILSLLIFTSVVAQTSSEEKVMTKEDFKMLSGREKEIMRQWCKKNQVMYPVYLDTTITNQNKWDVYDYSIQTIARIDASQNDVYLKQVKGTRESMSDWTTVNERVNQLANHMQMQRMNGVK